MIKEIKYFIYIATIIFFLFFVGKYYFSETNKKNNYLKTSILDKKILNIEDKLPILESDTDNVVEYVENTLNKNKKKYYFWNLLKND
jgi:hypothetical protein|tara:strand:- start:548 stop:808 length:261 start_codon:yes stop_codon:yes gene_type:complete